MESSLQTPIIYVKNNIFLYKMQPAVILGYLELASALQVECNPIRPIIVIRDSATHSQCRFGSS